MSVSPLIEITANGRPLAAAAGEPLADLLGRLGFRPGQVVIERNGEPLTPAEAGAVRLAAGDRLEIVRIVAGG